MAHHRARRGPDPRRVALSAAGPGGTLGVAVIGSVFNSIYVASLRDGQVFASLPPVARDATEETVGAAGIVAERIGPLAPQYLAEVSNAFLAGLGTACLVTAGVAAAGSVFAHRFLPARAAGGPPAVDIERSAVAPAPGAL